MKVHRVTWKLEEGEGQTLAQLVGSATIVNDPAPDRGEQLAKAQRLFYRLPATPVYKGFMGNNSTTLYVFAPLPVTMRIIPTVPNEILINVYTATGIQSNVSCAPESVSLAPNGTRVTLTSAAAITGYAAYREITVSFPNGIDISADM